MRPRHIAPLVLGALLCAGAREASAASGTDATLQPKGWDAGMRLAEARDLNPDPKIVEVNLEACTSMVQIGEQRVEAWTYNGGLPGPLIKVNVGDRLIVHFKNTLPQPTTVHWHGMRVPIQMDGVPEISQPEVKPGGEFTYDFLVPDAGLFWYHPHVMSAAQVGYGLYGALLVTDPNDGVGVADELVIVLSDIGIDERTGALEDPDSGGTTGMAFGREGNQVLVNGRTNAALTIRSGAPQRWRVVNASKSRYFQLDLDGQLFTLIGVDGGLQEYSTQLDAIQMTPGERIDVIVAPKGEAGGNVVLKSFLVNRGYGSIEFRPAETELITMNVADLPAYSGPAVRTARDIAPLNVAAGTRVDMKLTIAQLANGTFEYRINGKKYEDAKPFHATPGETQVWTVTNDTPWSHPYHLHGFFFQILDQNGAPVRPLAWKDTVDVPFKETRTLAVRFDEGHEGNWMIHCHILDHAEGGLMGTVLVGADGAPSATPHKHTH